MLRRFAMSSALVLCVLMVSMPAAAQQAAPTPSPKTEAKQPKGHNKREREFRALAPLLQTTPGALDTLYRAATKANPFLTRKQFVTALVVAHDLGATRPKVTADALLAGLQSGKSVKATLQSLGLSEADAAAAEKAAKQEAQAAEQPGTP